MRLGEQVAMWHSSGQTSPVTQILAAPLPSEGGEPSTSSSAVEETSRTYAVAYQDGSIRLWEYQPGVGAGGKDDAFETVTFNGHKKAVTGLAWDERGTRLFSSGMDGEIIVWDCIGEVGLFRYV